MRTSSNALSFQPLARILHNARTLFGMLLVLTVGLLAWHHYGMERTIEFTGGQYPIKVEDDRTTGGASVGTLERRGHDQVMHCKIVKQYAFPYCKMMFTLQTAKGGLDMSELTHFTMDIRYEGVGPARINLLLANVEEGMAHSDHWNTYKINQIDFTDVPPTGLITVPLKWFAVPQWWKELAKPTMDHSYVRMDNVAKFEIMNAAGSLEGDHVFTVRAIKVHGKLISQSHLLMILVALWIVCAVGFLAATTLLLRSQLKESDTALALLSQVNKALELEARELAGQAYIDPLTGVLNRQGLRAALMSTSSLLAAPMSVIFLDIDHFKRINDAHGHDVGDEVLRKFAHVLGAGLRSSDRLVRWGGEEFLIVCPVTDVHQASKVAENLRINLHRQSWPAGLSVTASFGVAQHADNEDIGVVIKLADNELYGAKAAGRNRVHAYGVERTPGAEQGPHLVQVA
jgi:diguanylate cyclase (GGDEF)-like protein